MKKIVNGIEMDLTPTEEAEFAKRERDWAATANQRLFYQCKHALIPLIDKKASEKQYLNAVSCASYVTSSNDTWADEASAFIVWRDNVYEYAFDYFKQVQEGAIRNPSMQDFLAGIPSLVWP